MIIQKLKIIIILFSLSSFFITSLYAQTEKVYNLSIKDEAGEEIGQYFDVKIDSIIIASDTTLNFQLIPKIEIQDSVLKQKYSTFLEMLIRNTNAEIDKRWKDLTFDFGSYKYEGLDYADRFRIIGNEINSLTSINVIKENVNANANISVDYSSRNKSTISITNADSSGYPLEGILYKKNYALDSEELSRDIRSAYLNNILLNNNVDENLFDTDGNFTIDAINLIKINTSLHNETDLNIYLNEVNCSPVSIAKVNADTFYVGETIEINGSDSFDPDGSIVSFALKQLHMEPKTLEYMTEWDYFVLQDLGDGRFRVKADKPGTYWNELTVTDDNGLKNSYKLPIIVKRNQPSWLEYKGFNFFDTQTFKLMDSKQTFEKLYANNINMIFAFAGIELTQTNPLPVLTDVNGTSSDEFVELNKKAMEKGIDMGIILQWFPKPDSLFDGLSNHHNEEWWNSFFNQYIILGIKYAKMAQDEGIKMLNLQYLDLANSFSPEEKTINLWKGFINEIKGVYDGKIGLTLGIGGDSNQPWNVLQYTKEIATELDIIYCLLTADLGSTSELSILEISKRFNDLITNPGYVFPNQSFETLIVEINKPVIMISNYNSAYNQNNNQFFEPINDQPNVHLDMSNQVKLLESLLDNIKHYVNIKGFIQNGYHIHDIFYVAPNVQQGSFNKSPNVRNKPSESVLQMWFDLYK